MSASIIATRHAKAANANAAEAMLTQAYSFAAKSGMTEEMRAAFRNLEAMLSEHRSELQESASDAMANC